MFEKTVLCVDKEYIEKLIERIVQLEDIVRDLERQLDTYREGIVYDT